jgi:hypothetical protein
VRDLLERLDVDADRVDAHVHAAPATCTVMAFMSTGSPSSSCAHSTNARASAGCGSDDVAAEQAGQQLLAHVGGSTRQASGPATGCARSG